jgi:hypothetical protein
MKPQIDFKSVLIGILLALCVFLAMGAASSSHPMRNGRYHLAAVGDDNAYIVDSSTGRVWRHRTHNNGFEEMNIHIESKEEK